MKHGKTIAICLAGGLVSQANIHALTPAGNPYTAIATRNVFNLKSPLPERPIPPDPPPKITLLGIVSGFAAKQVMFKTLVGTPPKETSFMLGENEQADGIEVIEIREGAGVVRVKNRGQEQTLSLEQDGLKPGGISPAHGPGTMARSGPVGGIRVAGPNQPQKPELTPEEQVALIEINRVRYKKEVDQGLMPPLPPTPIGGK